MDPEPLAPDGAPGRSAERRGSIAFKLLAAVVGVILVITGGNAPGTDFPLLRMATIGYALGVIAVDVVMAVGLDLGAGWAVAAMRPILWLQLLAGIAGSLATLARGSVPIPFDLVVLAWALRGRAAVRPTPPLGSRAVALIAAALVLVVNAVWLGPIFGAGGALDVHPGDLRGEINFDCRSSPAGIPETLTLTYRWSWARSGPPTGGSDDVVIVWDGRDETDGGVLYIDGGTPSSDVGIESGGAGVATGAADVFARGHEGSVEWAVDLGLQRYAASEVSVTLRRAVDHPISSAQLTVEAVYSHAGVWRTLPTLASCQW